MTAISYCEVQLGSAPVDTTTGEPSTVNSPPCPERVDGEPPDTWMESGYQQVRGPAEVVGVEEDEAAPVVWVVEVWEPVPAADGRVLGDVVVAAGGFAEALFEAAVDDATCGTGSADMSKPGGRALVTPEPPVVPPEVARMTTPTVASVKSRPFVWAIPTSSASAAINAPPPRVRINPMSGWRLGEHA